MTHEIIIGKEHATAQEWQDLIPILNFIWIRDLLPTGGSEKSYLYMDPHHIKNKNKKSWHMR